MLTHHYPLQWQYLARTAFPGFVSYLPMGSDTGSPVTCKNPAGSMLL
jgi:hypothetical protein